MITASELYWILMLDNISTIVICIGMISITVFIISFLIRCLEGEAEQTKRLKKVVKATFTLGAVLLLSSCFIPNTKQMAMIKILPVICNNKDIQTLSAETLELYRIGINATKEYLTDKDTKGETK